MVATGSRAPGSASNIFLWRAIENWTSIVCGFASPRTRRVVRPSKRSVERALEASGFEKISWEPLAADGAPDTEESYEELVGVFTARLA